MHIAVSGSRGFIGRRVVETLLNWGVRVTSIERLERRNEPSVWPNHVAVDRRWIDLSAKSRSIHEDCGFPDALIHLAWGGLPNYSAPHHLERELPLHTLFLSGALQSGTPHVIAAGTCFEYGLAEGRLEESTPTQPITSYAEAKVQLHEAVERIANVTGGALTWLRLFYVFGPGQPESTLWGQLHAAIARGDLMFPMSGGQQKRDYLHVNAMSRLIAEVAIRPPSEHSVLNVCSGDAIRIRDLVDSWIEDSKAPIVPVLSALPYSASEPMTAYGSRERLNQRLRSAPTPDVTC